MTQVTGPLMSLSARGTIGKTITFSGWKGVQYARQRVIPANPRSLAQQETRGCFQWVHDAYKYLPALVQEPWVEYAKGQPFTPPNAWMSANLPALRGQTNLTNIIFTKPVKSGPPCPSITATAGTTQITIAAGTPSIIAGWSITNMTAIAMKNVDPTGEMEAIISKANTDTTDPYSLVLTGLTTAQQYICGAFFKYLRSDGAVAYGSALTAMATPT